MTPEVFPKLIIALCKSGRYMHMPMNCLTVEMSFFPV